jgi:hypothetical protein
MCEFCGCGLVDESESQAKVRAIATMLTEIPVVIVDSPVGRRVDGAAENPSSTDREVTLPPSPLQAS